MDEQFVLREGPTGPRVGLVGGPDVREVIRAVVSARSIEPPLSDGQIAELIATNTGLSKHQIESAISYWSEHPVEIDAWISECEANGW